MFSSFKAAQTGFSQEQRRKSNFQEDWLLEGQENVTLFYFISGGPCQLWSLYYHFIIHIVNIEIMSFLQKYCPVKVWFKKKKKKKHTIFTKLQNVI